MKIVRLDVAKLSNDPANARKHDERNIAAIVASLRRFGQQKPIVVDSTNVVRAGNGTLEAARVLGWDKIDAVVTDLSGSEATPYAIADNRTAELAAWDEEILAAELNGLLADDADLLDAAGFTEEELEALLKDVEPEPEVVEDEVPEVPVEAITKPGDLWLLGSHRLLCGDSSDPRNVERLLAGGGYQISVVDPPYELPDHVWSKWISDPSIVFGQMRQMRMIPPRWWRFERVIVKGYSHRSATVQIGHRHAFVAQVGSDKVLPKSAETFDSIVEQEADTQHDHQKPVSLLVEHLTKWSPQWNAVIDPFLGSGTTLIAAEQLGRKCYGLEISPQYCDVIVKRWENLTGEKARLQA